MARVIIVIEDLPDGAISVEVGGDTPGMFGDSPSPAQGDACKVLTFLGIHAAAEADNVRVDRDVIRPRRKRGKR